MAKQETLTLFPELEQTTRRLSDEQFGILMRAVWAYRFRGEVYSGDDVAIDIAFQFVASQVDRSEETKVSRAKAANSRWDANECKAIQSDANECKAMQSDAPILSNPILSNPIHSNPILSSPIESEAGDPPPPPAPPKPARKSYGRFGWVKLTDEEYSRLSNDLGEAEVKRCIAYVDESAQTTGNKNKWRDWNLVVRKCHREGWGRKNQPSPNPQGGTGNPFLDMLGGRYG